MPSVKKLRGCVWNHSSTVSLTSSLLANLRPFHDFFRGPNCRVGALEFLIGMFAADFLKLAPDEGVHYLATE